VNDAVAPTLVRMAACPLCGTEDRLFILGEHSDDVAIARCSACDLVHASGCFASGVLDEDVYAPRALPPDRLGRSRKRKALELYDRLLDGRLRHPIPGSAVLDIGCGTGALLDELASWGYATEGIERAASLSSVARMRHRVHTVDVTDPGLALGRRFSVISMIHVLEHLDRPIAAMRFVARHLEPGGVLVVEVPNWNDPARVLWGLRYRPLELGDHVAFYERETLTRALEHAGLRVATVWGRPQAATSFMPSLLSALDLGLACLRRSSSIAATPSVASPRVQGRTLGPRLRELALDALDKLDPLLARVSGADAQWGANLIAVASLPHDALH
jgi:SAM-dependent methyltransferase